MAFLLFCGLGLWNCNDENQPPVSAEILDKLLTEIQELSLGVPCEDASEWRFTALGSKPCGGPWSYIAYSSKIDTLDFLNKVKDYTERQRRFNIETGAISDCALAQRPEEVICRDGKPVFSYRLE